MDPQEPHDPHADLLASMSEAEKERYMCQSIFEDATAIFRDDGGQAFSNQFLNDSGDDDDNVDDVEVPSGTNSANVYVNFFIVDATIN